MSPTLLTTRWSHLAENQIRRLQAEKLRNYLRSTVIPFSAYYRDMFQRHGIHPERIRCLEDLEQIPFTCKSDLLNTPEHPQRAREFVLIPDQHVLSRRPSTIVKAMLTGRENVKRGFE